MDAVRTRIVVNSASAPDAARPSTGINPKNGHLPEVQIGFVATTETARASSSGGAARNVGADGTRPNNPPQTNARTSGFFAAQDSSSGRRAVGARQRRRGSRRGCTNASPTFILHTRAIATTRRQLRHWCKRTRSFIVSIRTGTAVDAAVPVTSPNVALINTRVKAMSLHRPQSALMQQNATAHRHRRQLYVPQQLESGLT